MLDWLDAHHPKLVGAYCFFYNRLTGSRCYAQGCGRLLLLHTPRQWDRCCDTPISLVITAKGYERLAPLEEGEALQGMLAERS